MIVPNYEEDLRGSMHKKPEYIRDHWPEFYQYLEEKYQGIDNMPAKLYMFYNNIDHWPVCTCGKLLEYRSPKLGFRKFCSIKCATNDKGVQEKSKQTQVTKYGGVGYASKELSNKSKQTTKERYGVDNAMQCEDFKSKQRKSTQQSIGVEYATQNPEIAKRVIQTQVIKYGGIGAGSPSIKEKIKQTHQERYGGMGYGATKISKKIQDTNELKYGVRWACQSADVKNKIRNSRNLYIQKKYPIIKEVYYRDGMQMYKCFCQHTDCKGCDERVFDISCELFHRRLQDHTELCTTLLPPQQSMQSNTSIEIFIKRVLDKYNIEYIQNDRKVLDGQELDFYIPNLNLGIECNGCLWHSSLYKGKQYHMDKFIKCKDRGVQLIQVWEDWIINHPEIVESILVNKIHQCNHKVYGRQCDIKIITAKEARVFMDSNHIQGFTVASVHIGLIYNSKLISVMSFGRRKPGQGSRDDTSWELVRFCSKLNYSVVGGASKLLKYFIDKYKPSRIISFSANDISNGNLYKRLGFVGGGVSMSYWYISYTAHRYHRYHFNKNQLKKMGFDISQTETQIMSKLPYYKIYDSGTTKWTLEIA